MSGLRRRGYARTLPGSGSFRVFVDSSLSADPILETTTQQSTSSQRRHPQQHEWDENVHTFDLNANTPATRVSQYTPRIAWPGELPTTHITSSSATIPEIPDNIHNHSVNGICFQSKFCFIA